MGYIKMHIRGLQLLNQIPGAKAPTLPEGQHLALANDFSVDI
jgi:hypothetical protein